MHRQSSLEAIHEEIDTFAAFLAVHVRPGFDYKSLNYFSDKEIDTFDYKIIH